jgi:hypothetical protein
MKSGFPGELPMVKGEIGLLVLIPMFCPKTAETSNRNSERMRNVYCICLFFILKPFLPTVCAAVSVHFILMGDFSDYGMFVHFSLQTPAARAAISQQKQ